MKTRTNTIEWRGLIAEYSYTPKEPEVRYYGGGDGHPGSASEIEVTSVEVDNLEELQDHYLNFLNEVAPEGDCFGWLNEVDTRVMEDLTEAIEHAENETQLD